MDIFSRRVDLRILASQILRTQERVDAVESRLEAAERRLSAIAAGGPKIVSDTTPTCGNIAAARQRALLEATHLICPLCADGRHLDSDGNHVSKPDQGGILLPDGRCGAWAIHERMREDD